MDNSGIQEILHALKLHSAHIDEKLNTMRDQFENRFNQVDARFEQIDKRLDNIENRLERVETKLSGYGLN